MFYLLKKEDANVLKNKSIKKSAEFFVDELAFFDAFCEICEHQEKLTGYCFDDDGNLSLDGVCFFIKTYASEFNFKSLDLSLDYLKILYYFIASHSQNKQTVERDVLANEILFYKNANQKDYDEAKKQIEKADKKYKSSLEKFEKTNNSYAKKFVWSNVLEIFSILSLVLACFAAIVPMWLFSFGLWGVKKFIIYLVAIIICEIVLYVEFKIFSNYLKNAAKETAYELQSLKKDKDSKKNEVEKLKQGSHLIFVENYEYCRLFSKSEIEKVFKLNDIFKLENKNEKDSPKTCLEIAEKNKHCQEKIYEIVETILTTDAKDVGKLDNILRQIEKRNYLKFNKLVKASFVAQLAKNAAASQNWALEGGKSAEEIVCEAKNIFEKQKFYVTNDFDENLLINCNQFLKTFYLKKPRRYNLKNISDESSFLSMKNQYISSFWVKSQDKTTGEIKLENVLPKYFELKFDIIKSRLYCASLDEKTYLGLCSVIEKTQKEQTQATAKKQIRKTTRKSAKTKGEMVLVDIDDENVLCTIDGRIMKGFKFSKL